MAGPANNAITKWLQEKGYSDEEVSKILAKLAEHDHQTLSDALFDSIGNSSQAIEDIIGEVIGKKPPGDGPNRLNLNSSSQS